MAERQYTVVCTFDPASPKITEYNTHVRIHDTLRITEMMVDMIQTDGPKLQVYIKMTHTQFVQALLRDTCGQAGYRHNNGEISIVNIDMVGMGTKKVWIPNLPPEVLEESLQSTLAPYGKVMIIQDQIWSRTYR